MSNSLSRFFTHDVNGGEIEADENYYIQVHRKGGGVTCTDSINGEALLAVCELIDHFLPQQKDDKT